MPGTGYSTYPLIVDAHTYLVNVAGSARGAGIYRTTDGGATWSNVSFLGPNGPPLVASDGTIYWAVDEALAKSSDHGLTWSQVGGGFVSGLHPIEVPGGRLVTAESDTLVVSSDGGATWQSFGPTLPYVPAGVAYSENQKALFIWHSDCGSQVLPDAIQKLSYDVTAAPGPTALAGVGATGAAPATVQLLANWVSPTYLAAGQSLTVHQDAYAHQSVNLTLSVDVFDGQGQRVAHSSLENQVLAAEQTTPLEVTIPLPTWLQSGVYVVKIAAVGPDGTQYAGSDAAGKFVATAALPPAPSDEALGDPDQQQAASTEGQ
ncbi:MAG: exo-alpha-sialidase [Chloroflexi bacterium]|nr:exo-alpha-sialidase [Chloroflexota bacterium]